MAMRVNRDLGRALLESKRARFPLKQIVDEFLEKKAARCDRLRRRAIFNSR